MKETLQFIFSKWWILVICLVVTMIIIETIKGLVLNFIRHRTIRKIGYPPSHCDVDGMPVAEYEELPSNTDKD